MTNDPVREGTIAWALGKVEVEPRPPGTREVSDYDIARQVLDYEGEVAWLKSELATAQQANANLRTTNVRYGRLLAAVADALKGPSVDEASPHVLDDLPAIAAALRAPVTDMALCEQGRVGLRPGQVYRFSAMPGCTLCERDAAPYADQQPTQAP